MRNIVWKCSSAAQGSQKFCWIAVQIESAVLVQLLYWHYHLWRSQANVTFHPTLRLRYLRRPWWSGMNTDQRFRRWFYGFNASLIRFLLRQQMTVTKNTHIFSFRCFLENVSKLTKGNHESLHIDVLKAKQPSECSEPTHNALVHVVCVSAGKQSTAVHFSCGLVSALHSSQLKITCEMPEPPVKWHDWLITHTHTLYVEYEG